MSCLCTRCGKKYKVDLNIPDVLWERISRLRRNDGLLCGGCIMDFIENVSGYDSWHLIYEKSVREQFHNIINGEGLIAPRQIVGYAIDKLFSPNQSLELTEEGRATSGRPE